MHEISRLGTVRVDELHCSAKLMIRALFPTLFRSRVLTCNLAGDKTFGDVSCFQIKMTADRADLAGDVEARDRFFHWVEHVLLDVVLRATLRVVYDRPSFHAVERRGFDRHLCVRRQFITPEFGPRRSVGILSVGILMLPCSQRSVLAGFRVME